MYKTLTACALVTASAVGANAQSAFQNGEFSITGAYLLNGNAFDLRTYDFTAKSAFQFGNVGLQVDIASAGIIVDSNTAYFTEKSVGTHTYYQFDNGAKIGVYAAYSANNFITASTTTYGVEAMVDFGRLELEAAFGQFAFEANAIELDYELSLTAYYSISEQFEINASYYGIIDAQGQEPLNIMSFGATYQLPNIPVSLNVGYSYASNQGEIGDGAISGSVSYQFGPNSENRLFGKRNFSYSRLLTALFGFDL